jgi:hypothetical protein
MKTEIGLPTNTNRQCDMCQATRSYERKTAAGMPYFEWRSNPFKNEGYLCGRCYGYLYHSNLLPPKDQRRLAREERINKRICVDCRGTTTHIQGKYRIWHKHSQKDNTWLCAKCYAKRVYELKKKYKTKQERYENLSRMMSENGNQSHVLRSHKYWENLYGGDKATRYGITFHGVSKLPLRFTPSNMVKAKEDEE